MNSKQKLHQIKLTHWATRFQEQAASGLTAKAWCDENNITIHTYNYWKHKLAGEREVLKVAGCWIHARRPFTDFIKSAGLKTTKGTIAQEAYDMITDILHTDNEFDDLSNTDRKKNVWLSFRIRLTLISNG